MKMQQQHLDSLLQQARSAPVFISADEATRFLLARTESAAIIRQRGMPLSQRTIIATGGVMIIIAVLLLVFSFGTSESEKAVQKHFGTDRQHIVSTVELEKQPGPPLHENQDVLAGDDSVKTKKGRSSAPKGISKGLRDAVKRIRAEDQNSEENKAKRARENAMYAEWTKQRIEGFAVYELDTAELECIGIVLTEGGGVLEKNRFGSTTEMKEDTGRIVTYTFTFDTKPKKQRKKKLDTEQYDAILVTNSRGQTYSTTKKDSVGPADNARRSGDSYLQRLIPIKVPTSNPAVATETGDYFYLYWFESEPGFIELLPMRVQRAIEEAQQQLKEGDGREREGGTAMPRTIAASIHPNPVTQSTATVEYTLPEPRRVAMSMYDMTGEYIQSIYISKKQSQGTWREQVELGDVENGLYLFAITTDQGEQSVHPIMVKR